TGLRILVAEDNAINQRLAQRLLEKRGHSVVIADNGREALAAIDKRPFDLVLMDVQMPEMGGLEATAAIRNREKTTGEHLPIVAITARAMVGDRERCIAAGMDGYVSKPIQSAQLFETVGRLTSSAAKEAAQSAESAFAVQSDHLKIVDKEWALEQIDGDEELLAEMSAIFLKGYREQLCSLRTAVDRGNTQAIAAQAHAIKGSVGSFGARAASQAALQIEEIAKRGDLTHASEALRTLDAALRQLDPILSGFARKARKG
ncbi:MAG: response regulator, partial [Terriglobia bacterium]